MDEKRIIEAFLQARTEVTFGELFAIVYPRVRRYFRLRGMDAMMAEDLTQNVLLIVFQRSGELREANLFLGWVFAIARNESLRFWRQSRAREDLLRIDYRVNERHTIYGRYIHDKYDLIDPFGTFINSALPTIPTNRLRPGTS